MLIQKFPCILDSVRYNKDVFEYMRHSVLSETQGLRFYKLFYPNEKEI